MYTGLTVTSATGNLRSVFVLFFPHLLTFSSVFLRDLAWNSCSAMCSLLTYVMQLLTLSIYILLTTSKSTDDKKLQSHLNLLKTANLPQSHISSILDWCTTNCMELDISKTKVISSRKTNLLIYDYKLCQSYRTRTASINWMLNASQTNSEVLFNTVFYVRAWNAGVSC
jgi:hypothetical protein